jgi:phosphoesterase RecJ-like protein
MQYRTVKETARMLLACEDAYILIHQSPDGDCIGAGYGLAQALWQLGKRAKVLCSDPIPERYHFLLPDLSAHETEFAPQIVIAVDVADEKLLGDGLEAYKGKVDLCIDHHISNVGYARQLCLDGGAGAACQVLCEVLRAMRIPITYGIAMCLYTGMATDTGGFLYDNTSARTHRLVADLMDQRPEVPYARINRNLFQVKSIGRLRLDQILTDHLECYLDGACYLLCVTRVDREQYGIEESELDGIAGFPLQVEGAQVGIVLKEREENVFKVSMRSAEWVNVSAICQTLGGGGHMKAAGCLVRADAETAKKLLVEAVAKGMARH